MCFHSFTPVAFKCLIAEVIKLTDYSKKKLNSKTLKREKIFLLKILLIFWESKA